jgi:hypothetical protein
MHRYAHYRARKLGLPPPNLNPFNRKPRETPTYRAPAPAPKGVIGWVSDKFNSLRSGRTTAGAYESTSYGGGSGSAGARRGFGPLDPDEAWDARVDNEGPGGYYEEQELGLQDPSHGPYGGGGYGDVGNVGIGGIEEGRGRSRSRQRELDSRYDEEVHGGQPRSNPFGDHAEASSLRAVSPRPDMPTSNPTRPTHTRGQSSLQTTGSDDSPTERRSMFREDIG